VLVTLAWGALFYRQVEGWNLLDSFYFSVITLTAVGYGDFSPSATADKIFTIFYIFVGVGLILGFLNIIAARSTEGRPGILDRRRRFEEAEAHHHDDAGSQSEKRS